jgi:nucleotide-binding universal stress UspA family protein
MKKLSIQNIVVPIDFSRMSVQALKSARRLAHRFGASIHLAHVRQFNYAADFVAPAPPIVPFSFMPYEHNGGGGIVKELNALARECGIPSPICHVLSGAPPFDEICRLAQGIPADLIVMPTHGRTGLTHVFLGSTAERVVQHSPCPVFVVREKKQRLKTRPWPLINTILVPVDFSGCSRKGLRYAIAFANETGAKIVLLHATYLGYIYSVEGTALYDIPGLQKAARKKAERQMQKLVRAAKFGQVKFETVFTEASPVLDICDFAKDHDVDLIVTSTHGLTGFQHILIGSIAEKLVRHAPCSVLVVPSHPQIRVANLGKTRDTKPRALANSPRRIRPVADQQQSRKSLRNKSLTKQDRKLAVHAFPERRKTNKFRETHSGR